MIDGRSRWGRLFDSRKRPIKSHPIENLSSSGGWLVLYSFRSLAGIAPAQIVWEGTEAMLNGRRILIVEDNPENMLLIVEVLTALNYAVLRATDGEQGVEMACAEHPDLILMDLSLPRMDGWTATRTIKAQADLRQIPIIALTAHAMIGDRERALEAGCDDYVSKPINLRELARKITQYLS